MSDLIFPPIDLTASDAALDARIEALNEPPPRGADDALQTAIDRYRAAHGVVFGEDPPDYLPIPVDVLWGFSWANDYGFVVQNDDFGDGAHGAVCVAPTEDATHFEVTGAVLGADGLSQIPLSGQGQMVDEDLHLIMDIGASGAQSLDMLVLAAPQLVLWRPMGNIVFQQAPQDPALNGNAPMEPTDKDKGNTTYTIIKLPRLNEAGHVVMTGKPPNQKPVYDYFFYRGGKWWKIKDPTLRVRGDKALIDLRDGTGNPNFGPANAEDTKRANGFMFPTKWQDFWTGFDKATAIQLQGIAVTLGALTGTNLFVWRKIRQLRAQGKSWAEIWDLCWLDILKVVGLAVVTALPLSKILGRIFGPFIRRMRGRLLRPPARPPAPAGVTPPPAPPVHPPLPPRGSRADLTNIMTDYLRGLQEMLARLQRQLRNLRRGQGRFKGSARARRGEEARLRNEILKTINEIERMRDAINRLGLG